MYLSLNIDFFALVLLFEFELSQQHFPRKSYIQTHVSKSICLLFTNY